jgi:hypothetical protein
MCLTKAKPIKLEKDIEVYKIFQSISGSAYYFSPMYIQQWILGQPQHDFAYDFGRLSWMDNAGHHDEWGIYGGVFHSFKNEVDARRYKWAMENYSMYKNLVLGRCIIPKTSAKVFEGIFRDAEDAPAYGSTDLILMEIIR